MDWSFILSQWDFILFWFLSDVEKKVLISLRTIFKYSSQQPPISVGLLCVLFWQPGLSWLTRFITFEVGQEVGFTEYFTVLLYGFDILYISLYSSISFHIGGWGVFQDNPEPVRHRTDKSRPHTQKCLWCTSCGVNIFNIHIFRNFHCATFPQSHRKYV